MPKRVRMRRRQVGGDVIADSSRELSETAKMLVGSGVERQALYTTLTLEGFEDVNRYIVNETYYDTIGDVRWTFIHPIQDAERQKRLDSYRYARLIYSLWLKEYILTRKDPVTVRIGDVASKLTFRATETGDMSDLSEVLMQGNPMVFIPDFEINALEKEGVRFLVPDVHEMFDYAYQRARWEANIGFVVLSALSVDQIIARSDWPEDVLSTMSNSHTCQVISVEAPSQE